MSRVLYESEEHGIDVDAFAGKVFDSGYVIRPSIQIYGGRGYDDHISLSLMEAESVLARLALAVAALKAAS